MKRIIIFASGNGTNAQNIIEYFKNHKNAKVILVLSNKKRAKVLERAIKLNVSSSSFTKEELCASNTILELLINRKPDLIVLAGFLLKFPKNIIQQYPDRIINIHPALLPKYGGKGMYGSFVHESVVDNNEPETGITIHYVNENYDEGAIIFQKKVNLSEKDTAVTVANKVHKLEHKYFPIIIERILFSEENNK